MVKKSFKKKSKRLSTKQVKKVEKKVREHHRKVRKEARKNPVHKKKVREITIPGKAPFKEQLLLEAEEAKQKQLEEKERQKKRMKAAREKSSALRRDLSTLVQDAENREARFEQQEMARKCNIGDVYRAVNIKDSSLRAYYREFRKVLEEADVLIEVLDARDPLGCRCEELEKLVCQSLSSGEPKKLVLLLNKIDLVPKENVQAWLTYLRHEFPALPFKASVQTQRDHLSQSKTPIAHMTEKALTSSSMCFGADQLLQLLGNYARKKRDSKAITVGVVGFPNTGKSSVINSLRRSKVCNVGATAGVTTSCQIVQLDKLVKLLDSPGIVMAENASDPNIILRNCVKLDTVQDPVAPVELLLKRCRKETIRLHFVIEDYSDAKDFLAKVAKRRGKLRKGGIPDQTKAARLVLEEWNSGRIKYMTVPPKVHTLPWYISAEVVDTLKGGMETLDDVEQTLQDIDAISATPELVCMTVDTCGSTAGRVMEVESALVEGSEDSDKDDEMEDIEITPTVLETKTQKPSRHKDILTGKEKRILQGEQLANPQANKLLKRNFKALQKQRKRGNKLTAGLADQLEKAMTTL